MDNAGTNTTLTLTANFLGGTNGGAAGARTLGLNVNSPSDGGAAGTLIMLGAIPDVTPTNSTTVVAGGAVGYTAYNGGTVSLLNPTNTFSGAVQVKYARTLQVMTLADSNAPCSIGLGTNPPVSGTAGIIIGSTDSQRGGILAYVGTNNASCNRQICVEGVNFGGQSGATFLNNSPSNSSLHFSCTQPVIYYSGVTISNCSFTLGGSANTTNIFDLQITNTPLGNAALTVSGSTWQLTAAHSYAGATTVSGGTLLLNGSIGGSGVTNTGGTLGGSGTISSPVTIQSGGTLQPGQGNGSIGTLTINNTLKLSGKTTMFINRSGLASSLLTGISTLTYGGTLNVTNLGAALAQGDTFTLFSAATYAGAFASSNLPPLAAGLKWDTSQLGPGGNGAIKVVCDGTLAANAGSVAPICACASVPIGGSPTASGGSGSGYTYSWSPATGLDNPAIANPNASPATTSRITVTVTDAGGCTAQSQVTVTVNPSPSTSAISGSSAVCPAQASVAYSVASTSGSTYAWSVPSGASVTAGQGSSPITVTFGSNAGHGIGRRNERHRLRRQPGHFDGLAQLATGADHGYHQPNRPCGVGGDLDGRCYGHGSDLPVAAGSGRTWWKAWTTSRAPLGPALTNSAVALADARAVTNGYLCLVTGACSPATNSSQVALIVNQPPVAGDTDAQVTQNQLLVLANTKLLLPCSDPDGDPLTIVSAGPLSTNGGAVTLTSSNVTYCR